MNRALATITALLIGYGATPANAAVIIVDPDPPSGSESAVSAWFTAIVGASQYDAQAEYDRLINCSADITCDYDEVTRQFREGQMMQLRNIQSAATASQSWVNETGFVPGINFATGEFIVSHSQDILDLFVVIQNILDRIVFPLGRNITITNVDGHSAFLSGTNLTGTYYNINLTALLDLAEIENLSLEDAIVTQFDLGNGQYALGSATLTSVVGPSQFGAFSFSNVASAPLNASPELGTLTLNFQGFQTEAVPEPSTWAMLVAGFGAVGWMMRRRRVAINYG